MTKKALLAVLVLAGCQPEPRLTPQQIELLGECFSCAAYEVIKAESLTPAPQPPQKCCGKCKGGLVKSGDGLAWVSCPCDDSCPCKTNSLIPPKTLP